MKTASPSTSDDSTCTLAVSLERFFRENHEGETDHPEILIFSGMLFNDPDGSIVCQIDSVETPSRFWRGFTDIVLVPSTRIVASILDGWERSRRARRIRIKARDLFHPIVELGMFFLWNPEVVEKQGSLP